MFLVIRSDFELPGRRKMVKLFLVGAFVLSMATLTLAAAGAGAPDAPTTMVVHGQTVDVSLD